MGQVGPHDDGDDARQPGQADPAFRQGRTPLDYGSGHVRPAEAFNPGVVFDSDVSDWIAYGCSIGQIQLITEAGYCDQLPAMDPSDLNYPSISVGQLAGSQTVTRTLTNVEGRASQYALSVDAPAGFTASVSPSKVTIPPGQSRSFKVTLTRTTAPFGAWAFGSLTASGNRGQEAQEPHRRQAGRSRGSGRGDDPADRWLDHRDAGLRRHPVDLGQGTRPG
ncbi:MAG TPA: hypothetical protein VFL38_15285 [Humibacillus xanthopallidus]|nr:hypothetical protein [Humibacillus xanthopallidus]